MAYFRNLKNLNLCENCLSDLSPLSGLTELERLCAGKDPFLSDGEKAARKGKNHFTDYAFLKNLINLADVDFTDTDITDIEYACYLPNVREFRAYSNPITDVSPLEGCKKLYRAYFYNCPITDISFVRTLPDDTFGGIAINETGVSDITPLKGKYSLDYLDAHNSMVEDLSVLRGMNRLRYCTLSFTKVRDLSPLCGLEGFGWLTLSSIPAGKEEILRLAATLPHLDKLTAGGYVWTEPEKNALIKALRATYIVF